MAGIGISIPKQEAWDKVTGRAKYNDDTIVPGMLHAKLVTSPHAHARIISIDASGALAAPGVQAVLTGKDVAKLTGPIIEDRPPLAQQKVRYFGEPVAMVVANSEAEATQAAKLVKTAYKPLPVVNSVSEALTKNAPLIHPNLYQYNRKAVDVYPEPGTNICNQVNIIKGDVNKGWTSSDVIIEASFPLPKSDHIAMEVRNAKAKILPSGQVIIYTSTQSPYEVQSSISRYANIDESKVTVKTPLVGGGFGGKDSVQLEFLAFMASQVVNGQLVRITNTREEDIYLSPSREGLECRLKLGAAKDGTFQAIAATYHLDTGAYADLGPRLTKAMAVDSTGPYHFEHIWCQALCVYTNHGYSTAFRGFSHANLTFCIERAIDKMALALRMDPLDLRIKNAISPGHTSPTRVKITSNNTGNLGECLKRLKKLINWEEGVRRVTSNGLVIAKGMACLWKTSNSPPTASSGAILTFNGDGSLNLNCGAVEIGPGMKTTLAQIAAERLKMDIHRIHVFMEVDTRVSPEHWKTVASMTTYLAGNAVLIAAADLLTKLRAAAAGVLGCSPEELEVAKELVYNPDNPNMFIHFKDIAHSLIGSGSFTVPGLTLLDPITGAGKPGPYWTVGAQAVEVEFNREDFSYRIRKAATVLDAGKLINPKSAEGQIRGGMCMGLGLGSRESFRYNNNSVLTNTRLRVYKVMYSGETPEYVVDFIETPQPGAPYGARGLGEHGIIGIPAALANALSVAANLELDFLPLVPEAIWRTAMGG